MDEDFLLINELVDSDDEVRMETDLLFNDQIHLHSHNLLGLLHTDMREGRDDARNYFHDDESNEELLPPFNNLTEDVQMMSYALSNSQENFIQQFRVKHSVAEVIVSLVGSTCVHQSDLESSAEQQTLAVLFYLGQEKITIEDVCNRFNINLKTFPQILDRVTFAVCNSSQRQICLPYDKQKENTKSYYAKNNGLQGIIGCIDTLPFKVLSEKCEKSATAGHELLILQAIVNENGKFTHIYVSSTAETDEKILEMSSFYRKMASCCSGKEYFLGGPTYACRKHLLTPYPDLGNLSGDKIFLNLSIAACMQTTDEAFALLTKRFRKLVNLKLPDLALARRVITACCVVHNMADKADFDNINEPCVTESTATKGYLRINTQTFEYTCVEGRRLRDDVCKELL